MEDAQSILVIFLSTALAIFLLLGIILMVFLIDIVQKVRRMAEKGELIVNKAESAAEFVKQASIPVAIAKGVSTLSDMFAKKSSKSDDKEE